MDALILAIDLALFVLSCLVQWIIYPSMNSIDTKQFASWHRTYVVHITWIVFPLMMAQLALSGYHFYCYPSLLFLLRMALILSIWMITLGFAAPLHETLPSTENRPSSIRRLIMVNGWRTALWLILLALSLFSRF